MLPAWDRESDQAPPAPNISFSVLPMSQGKREAPQRPLVVPQRGERQGRGCRRRILTPLSVCRERGVPGEPAPPRPLRPQTQAHPHRLLAVTAPAAGEGLREEPLRGGRRAQAAGQQPQPLRDPGTPLQPPTRPSHRPQSHHPSVRPSVCRWEQLSIGRQRRRRPHVGLGLCFAISRLGFSRNPAWKPWLNRADLRGLGVGLRVFFSHGVWSLQSSPAGLEAGNANLTSYHSPVQFAGVISCLLGVFSQSNTRV